VDRNVKPLRSSEMIRLEAEAFRLLVDSTRDYAIFMLDPRGHVATWNQGARQIKGYEPEEIIGKHFSAFYPPDAVASGWPLKELEMASREGRFEDEGWRVRKDGSQFWANVVITALRGPDGILRGFGKVTRDMTERKAHEQRIDALRRELERRVEELATTNRELAHKSAENESFVYSVSHDLRSPLVNLQGFSQELAFGIAEIETLISGPGVPADVRDRGLALIREDLAESLGFIRNAVRHLGNIIDGLLRLSRVGRVEYEFHPVDLNEVVRDILGAMRSTVTASGARIVVGQLPVVRADRNAIGQVFANLIGNALKNLSPERPGVVEISATKDHPPILSIRDNGAGIPPEFQPKIFQVFQRVHPGGEQGEGMGLAIVRRIIERHGGRIWFESVPGSTTTFCFTIDRAAVPAGPDAGGLA
jgi:PAS domain S-box-containing protein